MRLLFTAGWPVAKMVALVKNWVVRLDNSREIKKIPTSRNQTDTKHYLSSSVNLHANPGSVVSRSCKHHQGYTSLQYLTQLVCEKACVLAGWLWCVCVWLCVCVCVFKQGVGSRVLANEWHISTHPASPVCLPVNAADTKVRGRAGRHARRGIGCQTHPMTTWVSAPVNTASELS